MLVIYEAAGMEGDVASYIDPLAALSEGRIRYETTEKDGEAGMSRG